MAVFTFEARDPAGRVIRGIEAALDLRELDHVLDARGLVLVRAREGRARQSLGGRGRRTRLLIDFAYHLATALDAGVPLVTALRDLQEDGHSPIADLLDDVTRKVESGTPLSAAMESYPALFGPLVVSLVAAGEETGHLPAILRDLVRYLEWTDDLRRKLAAALTYPAIVLTGLVGLCVLLTTVVLPNFLEIFVELDVELPLVTRGLLAFQAFMEQWGLALAAAAIAAAAVGVLATRTESGRHRWHGLVLRTPLVGRVVSMIEMSRFSHNLALLYASGIPIVRALDMVATIVQNRVVRDVVLQAGDAVRRGRTLVDALRSDGLVPPMVMRMIALGETSGALDRSLEHVATYYDREVPGIIDRSLALFNAGIVVLLGVVLGTVALGIFVPLYEMMGNLNG